MLRTGAGTAVAAAPGGGLSRRRHRRRFGAGAGAGAEQRKPDGGVENKAGATGQLAADHVRGIGDGSALLVTPSSVPAQSPHASLADYLRWAKAHPNEATYATPGIGSALHFLGALLARDTGTPLVHVPYRGVMPGVQDLIGGQVSATFNPLPTLIEFHKAGRIRRSRSRRRSVCLRCRKCRRWRRSSCPRSSSWSGTASSHPRRHRRRPSRRWPSGSRTP
jgi:tripartite-type tricarboxylate transporter receptor subunit TctC